MTHALSDTRGGRTAAQISKIVEIPVDKVKNYLDVAVAGEDNQVWQMAGKYFYGPQHRKFVPIEKQPIRFQPTNSAPARKSE